MQQGLLQGVEGGELALVEGFEALGFWVEHIELWAAADRAIVNALTDSGLGDLDDSADQRARGVVLAAVAPGVAHVLDLGFVQVGKLMFFGLRAEAQFIDVVDDLAQVVAAVDLVFDLAEDFADLVFERVGAVGFLLEPVQVGEQLAVDEIAQVVAGERGIVVELAVLVFGRCPAFPAVGRVEDEGVFLPSSPATIALSCSRPSRNFRNKSQEVCSV
ncbi:MAG TPA: hypothetical protein VMV78_07310 [Thiobacillus sp.]|nr:hypothetical protein [Thiobacillus sp.]